MALHTFDLLASEQTWRDPDISVLDDRRGPVPAVPLALLPQPWRDWIADTEKSTGAPADYVLQSVLAGVAAVCGAGVRVRVTPAWDEPLVLWQAVVGEPSTGKSAALAPMRRLLEAIEQEQRAGDEERRTAHAERCRRSGEETPFVPSQVVASGADPAALLPALADIVAGNPRGVLLWRDRADAWIGDDDEEAGHRAHWLAAWRADSVAVAPPRRPVRSLVGLPVRSLARFPVSILEPSGRNGSRRRWRRARTAWPRASCSPGPGRSPTARSPSSPPRATRRSCGACARCRCWRGAPTIPA